MKRNILYMISAAAVIIMGSCSKDMNKSDVEPDDFLSSKGILLSGDELSSISFDGNTDLPEGEVIKIVEEFIKHNKASTKSSASYNLTIKKDTVVTLKTSAVKTKSANVDNALTKVKFSTVEISDNTVPDKKGYSVVCSDARYPNVLSFIEDGKIEESEENASSLLIKHAQNIAVAEVARMNHLRDSLREKTISKICSKLGIEVKDYDLDKVLEEIYVPNPPIVNRTVKAVPVTNPGGVLLAQTGPFTQVSWNQTWPMNEFIPTAPPTSRFTSGADAAFYNGRYPVGCVGVAMAQIASYYKPTMYSSDLGRNVNWTTVLSGASFPIWNWMFGEPATPVSKEVAAVMKTIAVGSGTTFSEDGGSTSSATAKTYMQSLGIYMDNATTNVNWVNIAPSLNALRLVYATGSARNLKAGVGIAPHAWVIDGSQIRQRNTMVAASSMTLKAVQPVYYNCYVHCNVGWGGTGDGWFLTGIDGSVTFEFYPGDQIWDIDLRIYPNVRKI